jgi:hypothetical protein
MLTLRHFTLPAALCAALLALPAAADTVSSYARAYAGGQLCGAGPQPNCVTSVLFQETGSPVEVTSPNADGLFQAAQDRSYYGYDGMPGSTLSSWALADLNQGRLHLSTFGYAPPRPAGSGNSVSNPYLYGFASAWLGDTFSVLNADGSAYTGAAASTLSIQLDGGLYGVPESNLGFTATITLGRPGFLAALAAHDYNAAAALTLDTAGTPWLTAGDPLPPSLGIAVPASLRSFEWSVSALATFNFRQNDEGSIYAQADLGHTITVGLQTPDGTIAASASGLFPNTVQMQPVPEPATWALWLAGMLLVPALVRRGNAGRPAR